MAVDSNFASSLFQNLKLDDPWLPSRPWESISSESGVSCSINSSTNSCTEPLYDPSIVSENNLVRLVINALQGVEATLRSIEKLAESFCTEPADRTSNRVPNLWHRTSSTNALGKILKSIGRSGFVIFLLHRFVDYFIQPKLSEDEISRDEEMKRKKTDSELREGQVNDETEIGTHHTYSLVNQAFAVAVKKVVEGFICSLDTLYASAKLRRSSNNVDTSAFISSGCLTSVVHSEVTFLEVYLHTKELRTQIEALGNICSLMNVAVAFSTSSVEELTAEAVDGFRKFPRGADLLSYLYTHLRDADPVHHTLIEFLFVRSSEPYSGFIKSWIYQARISDPYKEFIVEFVDDARAPVYSHGGSGFSIGVWLSSIKVRDEVSVPCFMESFCLPLIRAGQQLQVLMKLLEMCHFVGLGDHTYEDILPCWLGSSSDYLSHLPPLTFSKRQIEEMVLMRESIYRTMQEKLETLFTKLDIRYQPISHSVTPFGIAANVVDVNNLPTPKTIDEEDSNFEAYSDKSDTSDCSTWSSSGEQSDSEEPTKPHGSLIEERSCLSVSWLPKNLSNVNRSPNSDQYEKLHALGRVHGNPIEKMKSASHSGHPHKETYLTQSFQSGDATGSKLSETVYAEYLPVNCWPLGSLSKNPFNEDQRCRGGTQLHIIDGSMKMTDSSNEVLEGELTFSTEIHALGDSGPHEGSGDTRLPNGTHASFNSFISPSWNLKYNYNVFKMNPVLTKKTWCHMIGESSERNYVCHKQPSLLHFDFSSVKDPCNLLGQSLRSGHDGVFRNELDMFPDSAVPATIAVDEHFEEQTHEVDDELVEKRNSTSAAMFENLQEGGSSISASGGAKWESSLTCLRKSIKHSAEGHHQSSGTTFSLPLDVIIDKCILQEILFQYKYVSKFTIKLLEDGFDLKEHLLALRRYHLMEFADWADLFIMSLSRHKWSVAEASQRISEIQGLLDLAVQRSSCKADPYKERLFVYMKAEGMVPLSTVASGVHAFDFVALGYRVDWPISIIITQGALKMYADIFSFLIQVKLAVFSLTDIWCSLKDLVHLLGQRHITQFDKQDKTRFNILTRMRHQINHFVSTLQQYVQSQLSHVSWCKFLYSLKNQVKDMLDLESVHMAYLTDSLHICFLSDGTRAVAGIIERILQCALDFCSCFTGGCWEVGLDQSGSQNSFAHLNFTQVFAIKATFERNLKELYLCYLKSPKHGEFSLCHFWEYLNYNDYYSNVINDGLVHYTF